MVLRSLRLSLTALGLLSLSMTGVVAQQQRSYPPEVVRNYINSCTAGRGLQVQAICACTIRKIQARYTLEQFKRINDSIAARGQIPPALIEILNSCRTNPNS